MMIKSKTVLVAALLAASVSGVLASEGPSSSQEWNYVRNPDAAIPQYAVQNRPATAVQGRLIEGRNVGVSQRVPGARGANILDRDAAINNISGGY
jgi:hypothetical protein